MLWQHDVQGHFYFQFFNANLLRFYVKLNVRGGFLIDYYGFIYKVIENTRVPQELWETTFHLCLLMPCHTKTSILNLNSCKERDFHALEIFKFITERSHCQRHPVPSSFVNSHHLFKILEQEFQKSEIWHQSIFSSKAVFLLHIPFRILS